MKHIAPISNRHTGGFNSLNLLAVDMLQVSKDGTITTGYAADSFYDFRKGSLDKYADLIHKKHRSHAIQNRLILQVDYGESEDGIPMTHLLSYTKLAEIWKGFDESFPDGTSSKIFLKDAK